MKYEVSIMYKGQVNYIIEAEDEDSAMSLAEVYFKDNKPAITMGTEWEEIETIGCSEAED